MEKTCRCSGVTAVGRMTLCSILPVGVLASVSNSEMEMVIDPVRVLIEDMVVATILLGKDGIGLVVQSAKPAVKVWVEPSI